MAFKCGHCGKKHDTVEEGRQCAGVESQVTILNDRSQEFLRDLLRQFGLVLTNDMTPETIPRQDGKKILHGLIDARRLKASSKPYSLPDGVLHDPKARTSPSSVRKPTRRRG